MKNEIIIKNKWNDRNSVEIVIRIPKSNKYKALPQRKASIYQNLGEFEKALRIYKNYLSNINLLRDDINVNDWI